MGCEITKDIARGLLLLVNDPAYYEPLMAFLKQRREDLKEDLVQNLDPKIKGAIDELSYLLQMRERANGAKNN